MRPGPFMPFVTDRLDDLYCQKVHDAICDSAPCILTIFCNDAFQDDSYLELRYQPGRSYASLYFCGISIHQIDQNRILHAMKTGLQPQSLSAYWQQLDLSPALHHVRITGEALSYLLEVLDSCQGIHSVQQSSGRDGCRVTAKSFWKNGAEFSYWMKPTGLTAKIADVVWLLADYLPRPARDSLQSCLSTEEARRLQEKLRSTCAAADGPLLSLQDIIQKGAFHAEN